MCREYPRVEAVADVGGADPARPAITVRCKR
jgi:hypothetical protein